MPPCLLVLVPISKVFTEIYFTLKIQLHAAQRSIVLFYIPAVFDGRFFPVPSSDREGCVVSSSLSFGSFSRVMRFPVSFSHNKHKHKHRDKNTYKHYTLLKTVVMLQMCCYLVETSASGVTSYGALDVSRSYKAGSLLKYHPWLFPTQYRQFDDLPKRYCCLDSNNCDLFYTYRPDDNCFWYMPPLFSKYHYQVNPLLMV